MRLQGQTADAGQAPADGGAAKVEASAYQLVLAMYAKSLPVTWAFVGLASVIFAVLGHPIVALTTALLSGVADYALHRMYKRWQTVAQTVTNKRGMTQLGAWLMARSAWNLAVPAGMAIVTHHPSDIVFALLMAGGMLLLSVIQAAYSTRLYVMAVIPPVIAGLVAIAAVQSRPQDLALFGALLWITAMLVFIGFTARGIGARERASRAEKNRMIAELQTAVEDANREKREADEAREAARRAALAKSTFLATMSHEIRTPLNGVLGMAQALERSRLNTVQRGQVATIQTSGQMLMLVLNDVLDLCEMEAGKLQVAEAPCELGVLLSEMMSFWASTAQDRGLELTLKVDDGLPAYLMLDGARVRQMLFNLVGNALKFTETGGVLIVVRAAERDGELRLLFEVTDTGIGIAPEALPSIFEAFSQAEGGDRRRYTGAGMGLAICKQLSQLLGGDIAVKSRLGQGSTFQLSLPLTAAAAPEATAIEETPSAARNRLSILAADDNPTNLLVLEQLLGAFGYTIWKAKDGREALEALSTQTFDLVLMDIQMPEMTGVEVLEAVRGKPGPNRATPLIAVTADALTQGPERYLDLGFAGFVAKPLHVQTLVSAMMSAVANCDAPEDEESQSGAVAG